MQRNSRNQALRPRAQSKTSMTFPSHHDILPLLCTLCTVASLTNFNERPAHLHTTVLSEPRLTAAEMWRRARRPDRIHLAAAALLGRAGRCACREEFCSA